MSLFKENSEKGTAISELGEFRLIDHLTKNFTTKNSSTFKSIGDDAAVIKSAQFNNLNKIEQHKLVYKSLKGKMGNELHALSITTEGK